MAPQIMKNTAAARLHRASSHRPAVCGVQQDDILGRRHSGLRQHRSLVRSSRRLPLRRHGLFLRETWSHAPQYKIGYCQQSPNKAQWPEELGPKPPLYFNAGMFVFEPSLPTYLDLLRSLKSTPPTPFAEQDFLNAFFKDVYKPIPNKYNLVLAMMWRHPENVKLEEVKVVHYCAAGSKPWRFTGEEDYMDREDIGELVRRWWEIYNDETLDYDAALGDGRLTAALTEAGVAHFFSSSVGGLIS